MSEVPALLDEPKQSSAVSGFEMKPRTMEEAMRFCDIMAKSELVPKCYQDKPGNIMVAIQMGMELGMTPMRALRSIAVINGRASMWGDDMLAMVLASPVCEYVDESQSTEKEGVCRVKRKGNTEHVSTFTLEDAKRAGLLGKGGTWAQYPARMLKLRARGFALRDVFADVLAGLVTSEEALDIPADQPQVVVSGTLEQPRTLKDKLREKVEQVSEGASGGASPETEPAAESANTAAAGAPSDPDDPAEPYRAKLRTALNSKAVNEIWRSIPDYLQQDCFATYTDKLKKLAGK